MSNNQFSRRKFLASAAAVGAAGTMGVGALTSCAGGGSSKSAIGGAYDLSLIHISEPTRPY